MSDQHDDTPVGAPHDGTPLNLPPHETPSTDGRTVVPVAVMPVVPADAPILARPASTKPKTVDIYALLSYTAGLGGFAAAIGLVNPTDMHLKFLVASLAGVSFLSGLALRVFYHQTTPPPT